MLVHDGLAGGRALVGVIRQLAGVEGPGQHDGEGAIGHRVAGLEGAIWVATYDAVLHAAVDLLIGPEADRHVTEAFSFLGLGCWKKGKHQAKRHERGNISFHIVNNSFVEFVV